MKFLALFLLLFPFQENGPSQEPVVEARVNNEVITRFEVDKHLSKIGKVTPAERKSFVRQLAENMLLQEEAKRYKIIVTDDDVTASIDREVKRLGSMEKLRAFLRFQGVTMSEYRLSQTGSSCAEVLDILPALPHCCRARDSRGVALADFQGLTGSFRGVSPNTRLAPRAHYRASRGLNALLFVEIRVG